MNHSTLQALRIPAGWHVSYNTWTEADANDPAAGDQLAEDLLQLVHERSGVLIDVGWYGTIEEGGFAAVAYQGDFQGPQLKEFRSRDRRAVVLAVESWLCELLTSTLPLASRPAEFQRGEDRR